MSRIDDALRRAHALKGGVPSDGAATELHAVEAPVVPSWQYERFPTESELTHKAERRTLRAPQAAVSSGARVIARSATHRPTIAVRHARTAPPVFGDRIIGGPAATACREHYDRVAAALHQAQRDQNTRLVMFTSALAGEGKSLTAANVAVTLSLHGRRVLLVDADLHRPTVHTLFQVSNARGLLNSLVAKSEGPMPVIEVAPNLSVLPAGRSSIEPMGLLISDRMRKVLLEASQAFDWVIVDTPPVCLVSDAHVLADIVPAVVLVVKAGSTPCDLISAAVSTLGRERILGVVLNCVGDGDVVGGHDHYGYGYGSLSGRE